MRISTNLPSNDFNYSRGIRDDEIRDTQNSIATSSRLNKLRNDPSDAAAVSRIGSKVTRYHQYEENLSEIQSRLDFTEGALQESYSIIHRVRELTVQGANSIYDKDQMGYIAVEVDQLLREMVQVANGRDAQNKALFAGTATNGTAYLTLDGRVEGMNGAVITEVQYQGNSEEKMMNVGDNRYLSASRAGNTVFWADNNSIYSQQDSQNYTALEDTFIQVDQTRIDIQQGDNIYRIIDKINNANVSVKARLDFQTNGIVLDATEPHQIWLDEPPESSTLKDLGLIQPNGVRPPNNLNNTAVVTGGNIFDALIQVRDSMARGDSEALGGRGLKVLDAALENLNKTTADIGSTSERSELLASRYNREVLTAETWKSNKNDINVAKAITRLKELEAVQQVAYQVAGKLLQTTLMDYLR